MDRETRSVFERLESAARQLDSGLQEPRPPAGKALPVTEVVGSIRAQRGRLTLVVLAIAVATAAAVVMLFLLHGGRSASHLPAANSGPAIVSQAQLEHLAAATNHPIYWAGPKAGYSYELTRASDGRIWIRYLPRGVKAGDPRPGFLVVGTYAQAGSFAYLKHAAKKADSVSLALDHGGIALFNAARPTSVYFGYPRANYQVEVYDPSADSARQLVLAGEIIPVK
jgi:hypothetical protein